ncbi:unnamed protein product [Paramecium octaurelia]|uniref:Uncharacterized protein n=1 Tax=Paramecium octaurelia TaxID=43137 RepID=A0A8S1YKS2_PAROT|nr:unnamed protein product [Paramecium octaurelia]
MSNPDKAKWNPQRITINLVILAGFLQILTFHHNIQQRFYFHLGKLTIGVARGSNQYIIIRWILEIFEMVMVMVYVV